jgi:hypothetical protein
MALELTADQIGRIAYFFPAFLQYQDSPQYETDMNERRTRSELYARLLGPDALDQLTELDFTQIIDSLWASRMWTNRGYYAAQLLHDNTLPRLRTEFKKLLWDEDPPVIARYDAFRKAIKGMGTASLTELLAFVHPRTCGMWNNRARRALLVLGFETPFPPIRKSQINGTEYQVFNDVLQLIWDDLVQRGLRWLDLLDVDCFLQHVWKAESAEPSGESAPGSEYDFDHNEVVDQLVAIGQWLGFQAEKERKVARGSVVDAIWQARIANLGVVTYIFEVQRRGSVDSLILNLQRAQNNPTVQRLIVVANPADILRVKHEIATLPESFRKSVGFMETREVIRAARLIDELSGIIGALELVRSEFSTGLTGAS